MSCPLCRSERVREFSRCIGRDYYRCDECSLVFVPPGQFLTAEAEKKRYDLHRNSPDDPGYRQYLARLFTPLQHCLAPGSCGLDFGSGPAPTLSLMFEEAGHSMTLFDRFYEPAPAALERQYDFITAAEVVEHLHDPRTELERLWACLRPGGRLGIMTQWLVERDAFLRWHYKNDLTHVCFFSQEAFAWLAALWDAELTFADDGVALFHKKSRPASTGSGVRGTRRGRSLPVLYQDSQLVVVNKPTGLLVHRSDIDRHASENAMKIVRDQLGQWVYPVHRLDKATSGILVFALERDTARCMTRLFIDDQISKGYLAIVRGFTPESGRIDHPLKERWDKMTDQKADRDKPGKQAVTEYRRLATVELPHRVGRYATARYSFLQVIPFTGRNHQIRRHLKHVFHPIVGDTTYGDGKHNDLFRKRFNCHRLLLHANTIEFVHPGTGGKLDIQAPPDLTMSALLDSLPWQWQQD
jgi:tRNA pseudouridine65 synthase